MRKRKIGFVDKKIQMRLIGRIVAYWFAAVVVVVIPLSITRTLTVADSYLLDNLLGCFARYWPAFLMLFALLPFAILDCLRITNQFAGPIKRLRETLQQHETGQQMKPIAFREDDLWTDLPDSINSLISKNRRY